MTKKLAESIKTALGADIEEIIDTKNRAGAFGYIFAVRDAMKKKLTELKPLNYNPADYDLIIVGTPMWAATVSTPIRTYLENNKGKFKSVAFFCTMGSTDPAKTFAEMENICALKPKAILAVTDQEIVKNDYQAKLESFIYTIKTL